MTDIRRLRRFAVTDPDEVVFLDGAAPAGAGAGAEDAGATADAPPAEPLSLENAGLAELLAWEAYRGPHGGTGWRDAATGEVRYQQERPGDEGGGARAQADPARAAKVTVDESARSAARALFGRDLAGHELAAMACAPAGATVTATDGGGKLRLDAVIPGRDPRGPDDFNASRVVYKPWFAGLTCQNKTFGLRGEAKGQGLALFAQQVEALRAAGVKRVETHAAGGPDGGGNGYYAWPRFGYGGKMSSQQIAKLPPEIRQALGGKRDVLDLFELPGGPEAWKAHGSGIALSFDLAEGSRNLRALEAYRAARAARGGGNG